MIGLKLDLDMKYERERGKERGEREEREREREKKKDRKKEREREKELILFQQKTLKGEAYTQAKRLGIRLDFHSVTKYFFFVIFQSIFKNSYYSELSLILAFN